MVQRHAAQATIRHAAVVGNDLRAGAVRHDTAHRAAALNHQQLAARQAQHERVRVRQERCAVYVLHVKLAE
jgi:hypothetical protein